MKKILIFTLLLLASSKVMSLAPVIDYTQTKLVTVAANDYDDSGGVVIPDGETVAIYRFIASGADPLAYTYLVYCYGDPVKEKIFDSTKDSIDNVYEYMLPAFQVTGDGVCELGIVIINDNASESPLIGGTFEAFKI